MTLKKIISLLIYPIIMGLVVFLHGWMMNRGYSLFVSTYLPVLSAALMVHMLEQFVPYQKQWLPGKTDFFQDTIFMAAIQVALPKALSFAIAIYFVSLLDSSGLSASIWPNEINLFLQAGLMICCADFFRYWLHRAYHEIPFIWRFHAVHHSPHKLYWLNVGRFHPIDKITQYALDALPFVILGVSKEVLALYFVFYAVNGFFQHCNIDMRLGVLNYLISGPELHRWHHSIRVNESNKNYGNNLIIWDLLFGTYFLPKNRQVGDLGLINRQYPQSFFLQMKAPFINKLDKRPIDK